MRSNSGTAVHLTHGGAFDFDAQVIQAPELDDLHVSDNLAPLRLARPGAASKRAHAPHTHRVQRAVIPARAPASRAQHRKPPATPGVVRARLLIAAMATGATAAAASSALNYADTQSSPTVLAADESVMGVHAKTSGSGVQLITVIPSANPAVLSEEFAKGLA